MMSLRLPVLRNHEEARANNERHGLTIIQQSLRNQTKIQPTEGSRRATKREIQPAPNHQPSASQESFIPSPTPILYNDLIKLRSPIFVHHNANANTLLPALLAIANSYPQALDYSYVQNHVPTNVVTFLLIKNYYGKGTHAVGFYNHIDNENGNESEGCHDWGDGIAEMFFTECRDQDLVGIEGKLRRAMGDMVRVGGEAEKVVVGGREKVGKRYSHKRLWAIVTAVWEKRMDAALVTRRPTAG